MQILRCCARTVSPSLLARAHNTTRPASFLPLVSSHKRPSSVCVFCQTRSQGDAVYDSYHNRRAALKKKPWQLTVALAVFSARVSPPPPPPPSPPPSLPPYQMFSLHPSGSFILSYYAQYHSLRSPFSRRRRLPTRSNLLGQLFHGRY